AGGKERSRLAAFDAETGTLDPVWKPSIEGNNAQVRALVAAGDLIYAGGSFTSANGEARATLAAFDAATGELDMEWQARTFGGGVQALTVFGNTLYAGGGFSNAGSSQSLAALQPRTRL